jgi:Reverse transcriptase (RNA-dependent DNA polymerase)
LETLGTDQSLLNIIKELYKDNVSYVRVGSRLSGAICTTKGLRQGCSLSPLIFNAYVEVVLREWKRSIGGMGIPINDETTLFTLSFADDQVVIAQDSYDLEFMIKRLYDTYKYWGLQVSLKKTEYLAVNTDANFEVLINDDVEIKQVEKFKYLGATLNKNGLGRQEILTRVQNGKRVVGCLNSVWWDRHISRKTKKRLGRTLVESVMCYGAELWTMGVDEKRRIQAVEMDYLRRSAGISRLERRTNEEVRHIMNATETINDRIEKRSLKWFGHVMRMPEERWPKKIFHWNPAGRKKRGRPRRSWSDTIKTAMDNRELEPDDVFDRVVWRRATGRQQ